MSRICSVCGGKGTVPQRFYEDELVAAQYASDTPEAVCRNCKGEGVI